MRISPRYCIPAIGTIIIASLMLSPVQAADPQLQFTRVSTLGNVVDIANAGDGSYRLFLVQKSGRIIINQFEQDLEQPFLDITDRVGAGGSEQGLLSVAFPPNYETCGVFFVWYTDTSGDTVLSRFRVGSDPNVADRSSETELLRVAQPYGNHNGGRLQFGPDGMLYLGLGDGGSALDPEGNGQDGSTLLGKLIRIDVDPLHGTYAVPADNPFVGDPAVLDEIWATGLRNPWRIAFDRDTGDLFIADVGQADAEEVNFQPAGSNGGENYGWSIMEGSACVGGENCDQTGLTVPVAEYAHIDGNCAITGGEVYRGKAYPNLRGVYYFADFCSGRIWGLSQDGGQWSTQLLADTYWRITTFGRGERGSVYLANQDSGVYLISDGPPVPEGFGINPGMNDAWYDANTPGQGFLITVLPDKEVVFLAWFTYDVERPPQDVEALLGEPGHRWLTAQGPYSGTKATMEISVTSGGVFDSRLPAAGEPVADGTMTIRWKSCNAATISYEIDSLNLIGEIPIERVADDNIALCELMQ
jgi:glucose/arabinose dehydrogenase